MKILSKIYRQIGIAAILFLSGIFAYSAKGAVNVLDSLTNAAGVAGVPATSIPQVLGKMAGAVVAMTGSVLIFLIVYGGFYIMTAAGDKTKYEKGKTIIEWAIVGLVFIAAAYGITALVLGALGTTTPAT